jgi:hypothetical protein
VHKRYQRLDSFGVGDIEIDAQLLEPVSLVEIGRYGMDRYIL